MHTQSPNKNDNQQQGHPFPFYFPFISVHFLLLFDRRTKKHRGMFGRRKKKEVINQRLITSSAEREGFEPPVPRSTTVFKTAAIDHSAISPNLFFKSACFQKRCKGTTIF